MKPGTRELLARILDCVGNALADERRRIDAIEIEQLSNEATVLNDAPHADGRRLINDWTLMLLSLLGKLAALGPWGDDIERVRGRRMVAELVGFVRQDLADALDREARPATTSDDTSTRRARWPS